MPSPIDIINLVRHVLQESKEIHNVEDVNLQKLLQYNIIQEPIDVLVVVPIS